MEQAIFLERKEEKGPGKSPELQRAHVDRSRGEVLRGRRAPCVAAGAVRHAWSGAGGRERQCGRSLWSAQLSSYPSAAGRTCKLPFEAAVNSLCRTLEDSVGVGPWRSVGVISEAQRGVSESPGLKSWLCIRDLIISFGLSSHLHKEKNHP